MKIRSREQTYTINVVQILLDNDDEVIVRYGFSDGTIADGDCEIEIVFPTGETPDWAKDKNDRDILKIIDSLETSEELVS